MKVGILLKALLERRKQQTVSSGDCKDPLADKYISCLYCCESGGTSDEISVMEMEQQPLVGVPQLAAAQK